MMRVLGYWLGLLGCWSLPALALAQVDAGTIIPGSSGPLQVQLFTLDTVPYPEQNPIPVSKVQCDNDVEITFRLYQLNMLSSSQQYLQLWQGTNCNMASQRDGEGTEADCKRIDVPEDWIFSNINAMFQDDFTTNVKRICDLGEGELTLYFLPVANTTDNAEVMIYGQYKIKIDKSPPLPMSELNAGAGQTAIKLEWKVNGADTANTILIWDTNVGGGSSAGDGGTTDGGGGDCSSGVLKEGDDTNLEALLQSDSIDYKEIPGVVSTATLSGAEIGAEQAAIVVVGKDLAGNLSKMSNVDCIQVVATSGFWDAYKNAGGAAEDGCGCSAPGARRSLGTSIWPFALGLLAWVVRRRTRTGARS